MLRAFVMPVLAASIGFASTFTVGGCGSSSSTGGGGGSTDPCFDYSNFDGSSPAVSFQSDVLPIFQRSCGLSMSCHGSRNPPASNQPYLGPAESAGKPSSTDMKAILEGIVGVGAQVPGPTGSPETEPDKLQIVNPGHPETSFMMFKLDADPTSLAFCSTLACEKSMSCGVPMPSGGPQLSSSDRDTIRRWIAQGAKQN